MPAILSSPEAEETQAEIDRRRGRFVPWIIAAFYMAFMSALVSFVFIAYAHPPAETTAEAYEKGLDYDETLTKAAAGDALGWTSQTRYAAGRATFILKGQDGKPIDGAIAKIWFVHPADPAFDRSYDLTALDAGTYTALAPLPRQGLWTVHVTAAVSGHQYQTATKIETR